MAKKAVHTTVAGQGPATLAYIHWHSVMRQIAQEFGAPINFSVIDETAIHRIRTCGIAAGNLYRYFLKGDFDAGFATFLPRETVGDNARHLSYLGISPEQLEQNARLNYARFEDLAEFGVDWSAFLELAQGGSTNKLRAAVGEMILRGWISSAINVAKPQARQPHASKILDPVVASGKWAPARYLMFTGQQLTVNDHPVSLPELSKGSPIEVIHYSLKSMQDQFNSAIEAAGDNADIWPFFKATALKKSEGPLADVFIGMHHAGVANGDRPQTWYQSDLASMLSAMKNRMIADGQAKALAGYQGQNPVVPFCPGVFISPIVEGLVQGCREGINLNPAIHQPEILRAFAGYGNEYKSFALTIQADGVSIVAGHPVRVKKGDILVVCCEDIQKFASMVRDALAMENPRLCLDTSVEFYKVLLAACGDLDGVEIIHPAEAIRQLLHCPPVGKSTWFFSPLQGDIGHDALGLLVLFADSFWTRGGYLRKSEGTGLGSAPDLMEQFMANDFSSYDPLSWFACDVKLFAEMARFHKDGEILEFSRLLKIAIDEAIKIVAPHRNYATETAPATDLRIFCQLVLAKALELSGKSVASQSAYATFQNWLEKGFEGELSPESLLLIPAAPAWKKVINHNFEAQAAGLIG